MNFLLLWLYSLLLSDFLLTRLWTLIAHEVLRLLWRDLDGLCHCLWYILLSHLLNLLHLSLLKLLLSILLLLHLPLLLLLQMLLL